MNERKPFWVLVRNGSAIIVGNDDPAGLIRYADDMFGPYDRWLDARVKRDEIRKGATNGS